MYHEWVHIQSAHKCIWMSSYDLYTLWLTTDEFVTRTHCGFVTCVFVTCIHYFMNEFIWLVYIVAHDRWVRDSYTLWLCDMCVRDLYTLLHEWVHMTCIMNMFIYSSLSCNWTSSYDVSHEYVDVICIINECMYSSSHRRMWMSPYDMHHAYVHIQLFEL